MAALRAFEAVGRLGGVRRAAKELSIDHAVVSRHVRSLEAWVGIPLVVRNQLGYDLTELGEILSSADMCCDDGHSKCHWRLAEG
ncbi:MAG: LysR family transcriptional regulator [Sphingomonadales bacterium]|nr:LysR family transcriptional regulator [Sphingomonadales bacterium]